MTEKIATPSLLLTSSGNVPSSVSRSLPPIIEQSHIDQVFGILGEVLQELA